MFNNLESGSDSDRSDSLETVQTFLSSDSVCSQTKGGSDILTKPTVGTVSEYQSGTGYPNSSVISHPSVLSGIKDDVVSMSLPSIRHEQLYSRRQPVAEYLSLVVPVQGCSVVISDDKRITLMPISTLKHNGLRHSANMSNKNIQQKSWAF